MDTITTETAELAVLSVGKGDMKMTFEPGDEAKAAEVIGRMLREGYGIFLEDKNGKLRRVKRFNAKRMAYVVTDAPAEQAVPAKGRTKGERQVPLAGSRGRVVGATAGG